MKNRWTRLALVAAVMLALLIFAGSVGYASTSTPTTAAPGGASDEVQAEQLDVQSAQTEGSDLYDPSIFIIEASGTWQQELAEGYYANFECELYLDKVDSNYNRVADGQYTGSLWLSTRLELSDYLKRLMKKSKVKMDFDAGGEGICDNLTINLLAEYGREPWRGYGIPREDGDIQPPDGALVAEGGLIVVAKDAYLNIQARGAQGESLEHSDSRAEDAELSYIIHIEPDPENKATEREATIYLYNNEGMSATLTGVWRRLPGYPEDVMKYADSGKAREILNKHLD